MKKHLLMWCAAVIAATMSLNARTVVIDEGFENGIQDTVWTQEYASGETPWLVEDVVDGLSYPSTVVQGTKRAYLRNTTGETQGYVTRLVSKVMDLSPRKVYQPELSFWYANPRWSADRDTLRVLYRNNTKGKWKQLAEYSTASANWQKVSLSLPEVGSTYQIAFEGKDNLGRGIVLDSILLQSSPECTVPSRIRASNLGANRVKIAWAASWDADWFEVIVSKDTIDPYEIDEETEASLAYHDRVNGMQMYCELTLEEGQNYLVYIRSLCPTETSVWSHEITGMQPFGFRVRETKQIPYVNNFDTLANTPNPLRDELWIYGNNTGKTNPYINTTVKEAGRAPYSRDKSPAVIFSGGDPANSNGPKTVIDAGKYVYMATPALADTLNPNFSIKQCQVHFWSTVYTYTGRQYGRGIIVGVMDDPENLTTFVPVDTVTVWGNQVFQENIVDFSSYTGNGTYIAFLSDFDRQNLFYLDEVRIEYRPEVQKVTKITVNPRDTYATISWEGNADSYNVLITNAEVDPANPSAEAIVDQATVTTNSYECEALEADHSWNRPYYVYVQAVGAEWSYRYPFVTIASRREIPYNFDFETASGRYKTTGSTYHPTGIGIFGNNTSYPSLTTTNKFKGNQCLYLTKTAGADSWITLPMVENLDSTQVKFYLSGGASGTGYTQSHAVLGIMTNPMDINTFHEVADFKLSTAGYTRCYANFQNYSGPEGVIAIVWGDVKAMTANTLNYIDEVTVEKLSDCVPPAGVALDVASDSVTVSWDRSESTMWEVIISTKALTTAQQDMTFAELAAFGTTTVADTLLWDDATTAPQFTIHGIRSQTNYYLYLRTVCDGDATWWTELPFTTPCPSYDLPYKETFESYTASGTNVGCWEVEDYLGSGYPMIYSTSGRKTLELWSTGTTHRNVAIMPDVKGNLANMMLSFEYRTYSSSTSSGTLYVGTMGDINDQSTFVPFDTITFTTNGSFLSKRYILSNYNLAYDHIAFSSGLGASVSSSDVLIDNVELKDATCIEAYDVHVTNIQSHSFDLDWQGLSDNDEWTVTVTGPGNTVVADTLVVGKNLHVDGLAASTNYSATIRTNCGDQIATTVTLQTNCERLDPARPNKETFENYSAGTSYNANYQAPCWVTGNASSSATSTYLPFIYNSSAYAYSGTKSYRMYGYYYDGYYSSSNYTPAYVISPEIDCTHLKEIAVTFSMYGSSTDRWIFGVMTNPHSLSTFVALDSVSGTGASTRYTYDLSEFEEVIPATARYIAWRTPYGLTSTVYLDDVSFSTLSCPITKPSYSEVTAESVRISSGIRTGDEWYLLITSEELSLISLETEGYVVPESLIVYSDTLDARSKVVYGLQDQTTYYVYTATHCDTLTTQWSTLSFTTPCRAVTPEELGTVTFSTADGFVTGYTARKLPCWTVNSKAPGLADNSEYIPYVGNASAYKHNGKNYLVMKSTSSNTVNRDGAYAIMPEMDVDSIKRYQVTFWGRGETGTTNSQVIIGVVSDPSDMNTFVAVDTVTMSNTEWSAYSAGFDRYEGDFLGEVGRYITFLSEFGISNTAYLSEISVELIPRCRPISSFSVDSVGEDAAMISWKGYQSRYRLLVATRALGEAEKLSYDWLVDSIVDHSNHVLLEGLQSTTSYYVYAQGFCDDSERTPISLVCATFRTTCPTREGLAIPFLDDFESYEELSQNVGCWVLGSSSSSLSTYLRVESVSGTSTQALEMYTSSYSSGGSYAVLPKVNGALEDMMISFDARTWSSSSSSSAVLYLGTMTDPNDASTFVTLESFNLNGSSQFSHYERLLANYDLLDEYIAFSSGLPGITEGSSNSSSDLYLDNVGLSFASNCHAPKLRAVGAASNSIEFTIVPAKAENTQWDIVVIADSVYKNIRNIPAYLDTTSTRQTVNTTDIQLSNLSSATSYYIYARTICSDEENSDWIIDPLKLTTQFYYKDSYFFGFEKGDTPEERWERSTYSTSDRYYLHPALVAGRDTLSAETTDYAYYPHSLQNSSTYLYAHTGLGALLMRSSEDYHGGYVIFPPVDEANERSFSFTVRPGDIRKSTMTPYNTYDGVLEIGTIDKNTSFDTYERIAIVRLDSLRKTKDTADVDNNYLFRNFTMDLDENMIATKQLVLYAPQQPSKASYLYIDNVSLSAPKGVNLVSINHIVPEGLSATVEWANIGGPWNLYIQDAAGNTVQTYLHLTGNSQLVEGLEPRTDYTAILEADGVQSDYVTSTAMHFRTTCKTMDPDAEGAFAWDFDDMNEWEANDVAEGVAADTAYLKPSCFTVGITYNAPANGYQWYAQAKNTAAHYETGRNDSHAMRIQTNVAHFNSYLVLPELNCDYDTMMIEFFGRCFANYDESFATESERGKIVDATYLGANYSQSMVVGTLSDPNDFSTLQIIDTLTYKQTELTANDNVNSDPAGLRYWELMQLPLASAQGTRIVLFPTAPGLFYVDDLRIQPVGNTLFAPTGTQTAHVTGTTADLSWRVYHPELATVVVLLTSTGEEVLRDTVQATNYALTDLNSATSFLWYVYQTDGERNTPTTKPMPFATECVAITPAYTCSFEVEDGWQAIPADAAYTQALCWTYSDAIQGTWSNQAYDPYNMANTSAYNYSRTGTQAVVLRALSSNNGSYQPYIVMPEMDINAYDTLQVRFWMRPAVMSATTGKIITTYTASTYTKSIIVGTMTDPNDASTFVAIDTVTYDGTLSSADMANEANNYLFQQMKVELAGATGPYVAFMTSFQEKGATQFKNRDYVWLDDIEFAHRQDCKDPKNLSNDIVGAEEATLSWDGGDMAGSYVLQVSTDAFFADEEAFVFNDTVYTSTYKVSGLRSLTNYTWRVKAICDEATGESSFSKKLSFKTGRSPYFYEPFNTAANSEWLFSTTHADKVIDSTSVIASATSTYGFNFTTNNYGLQGAHYTANGYLSDYHWMVTPNFYLPENDSVHFSMDLALTACNTSHTATANAVTESDMKDDYYFLIIVSEDGGATWKSENILAKWQNTNPAGQQLRDIPSTGMNVRYSLAQYAGKNIRIGLYREAQSNSSTGIAIHVDNIRLAYFDKVIDYYTGCQYEDIVIGDIVLPGEDTEPGVHIYPTPRYVSDADAQAGFKDTVYSLEVEVFPAEGMSFNDTICEGETYTDMNFHGKSNSGIYRRKMQSVYGCDSIITLNLLVAPRTYAEDVEVEICPGEVYHWNGKDYNRAGIYRDTILSVMGCDSIGTLVISYLPAEDTIRVSETITTDQLPYSYEDPAHPYIIGETPIFYARGTQPGVYKEIKMVQGATCAIPLVHTLTILEAEGVDNVYGSQDEARKVIYCDQMYIVVNDEWYTPTGQKVADPRQ